MWERGREELKHLRVSPDLWFAGWVARIQRSDAVTFGEAILGWDQESPGVVCTAFQASKAFEDPLIGKRITKELRRVIPILMSGRGVRKIHTYSLCIDPGAPKWFRLLGLEEDKDYRGPQRGPFHLRRFVRSR